MENSHRLSPRKRRSSQYQQRDTNELQKRKSIWLRSRESSSEISLVAVNDNLELLHNITADVDGNLAPTGKRFRGIR
jgi:hypothetical protein